jgi:hypothetical protein
MTRIVIAGGPRTGKTCLALDLAQRVRPCFDCRTPLRGKAALASGLGCASHGDDLGDVPVLHTDDLAHLDWSDASAAASLWFDEPDPWIIEGVSTVRALRKWLKTHESGAPCDVLIWLWEPYVERTKEQEAMAKGVATIWNEVVHSLRDRGVEIRFGAS